MEKDVRHKQSFQAIDDNGVAHTLHVFVKIIDVANFDDPNAELEGMKSYRTADGKAVNRLEKGKYKIVSTGQVLCSEDPSAP